MRASFDAAKARVVFVHETSGEYRLLLNFPAFLKGARDAFHWLPTKPQVVYNVIERLRKSNVALKVDKDVYEFLQQTFKLRELPSDFKFVTEPMDYQTIALRYLFTVGNGGLLLDPGMGKSKVVLDYIALMGFNKSIIVCPKPLLFVWEDEIRIHRPELTYHTIGSTDWELEGDGIANSKVTIVNYTKAVMLKEYLAAAKFDFIHLDEFLIKDVKTNRTKSLTNLAYGIPFHCGGSGTLINNSILDVFGPTRFLEPALVGRNYSDFVNRHTVRKEVTKDNRTFQQIVAFKHADEARSILESCCIVMTKERWLAGKMPKKTFFDTYVPMSEDQKRAYYSLLKNYIANVGGVEIEADNPLVLASKLCQIANGFVYNTPKDELNEEVDELLSEVTKKPKKKQKRQTLFFNESAKLEALQGLVTDKIPGRRAIIWFNMTAEYELISARLEKLGIKFLTIRGGEKDVGKKIRTFNTDPSFIYLVCQAKSVNYGVTVLGTTIEVLEENNVEIWPDISPEVHTEIFYSINFSLEVYLQQIDRIHRLGQKHECEYYRLFALSPIEARIRSAIDDKMSIRREMLVDVIDSFLKEHPDDLV
jgi:SNF2 family DNA or RNA helicase